MEQLSERLQTPISTAELERRWAAVRAAMEREKIDVLLMQNNVEQMGGYVKYFTDLTANNGYPLTVVFPRDDLMTLVSQGPFGGVFNPAAERRRRAPRRQAMADHAELFVLPLHGELRSGAGGAGACALRRRHDRPRRHLSDVVCGRRLFAEGTLLQHALRRRLGAGRPHQGDQERRGAGAHSPRRFHAGRRHARRVCRRSNRACATATSPPSPNATASATAASTASICARRCRPTNRRNSAIATFRTASSTKATRSRFWSRMPVPAACTPSSDAPAWSARLRRNSRTNSPSRWKRANSISACLSPARPARRSSRPITISWRATSRPQEKRLHCHGQGYDLVERPLIRNDEPMAIAKDMNIVVHPTYINGHVLSWVCDNYLIGENGPGERLHHFPEIITELG